MFFPKRKLSFWWSCSFFSWFCRKNPRGILISPGPGKFVLNISTAKSQKLWILSITKYFQFFLLGEPQDSGISLQTVLELGPTIPIFGVCMGLQCIGEAFGGKNYLCTRSLVFPWPHILSLKPLCTWICRKDYPCSFWSDAWKKLSSFLRWGIRKGLI